VDAVALTSKQGWVYLFDRTNGRPLFPIESRKYPASTVVRHRPVDREAHAAFVAALRALAPERR